MIPIRKIQGIQKEPTLKSDFSIRNLEVLMQGKPLIEGIHRHDFYYLLFIKSGKGSHTIDFINYPVQPNVCFLMKPGQVHQHQLQVGATGFLMAFQTGYYPFTTDTEKRRILNYATKQNYYQLTETEMQISQSLLKEIYLEYQQKQKDSEYIIRAYLDILMTKLVRLQKTKQQVSSTSGDMEYVERLQELIDRYFSKWKKAHNYASELHLSPSRLNAITKEILGKTCTQLIHERIILEAKRLLLSTTLQVSEIAYQLGYEDHSYFIRFFKKRMMVTPIVFRENYNN